MKEMINEHSWKPDFIDYSKLDLEAAKFCLIQSESLLKETTETYNLTTARSDRYLTLLVAIFTATISYLFAGSNHYLQSVSFFSLFPEAVSFYFLWKNFKAYELCTVGEEPKAIYKAEYVDLGDTYQYKGLIYNAMVSIQSRIEHNTKINGQRVRNNALARRSALFILLAFLAAAIYQYFCGYQLVWSPPFPR
jgi:hypothetical protein